MRVLFYIILFFFAKNTFAQLYQGVHFTDFEKETTYPFNPCLRIFFNNNYVNFISVQNPFSATYEAWKPAELTNKPFWFKTRINVRSTNPANYRLVISASLNDSSVFYYDKEFNTNPSVRWNTVSDSVLFPYHLEPEIKFKVFIWNSNNQDTLYIDDFYVFYNEFKSPDYLFDYLPAADDDNLKTIFSNSFYQLNIDTLAGRLIFTDLQNKTLIKQPALRFEFKNKNNISSTTESHFYLTSVKKLSDTTLYSFINKTPYNESELFIKTLHNSPQVFFSYRIKFSDNQKLQRASLVLPFADNTQFIFTPNGLIESGKGIQPQHWLGQNGGCIIGEGNRTIIALHNPNVSSTQIDNTRSLLVFNCDYALDHPMLHMPLLNKEQNFKEDISHTQTDKLILNGEFSLSLGKSYANIPFINPHHSTYSSTLIFTEHADWASTATHRAVYFGSSTIKNAKQATGGFVKYNIPVTKSVFYHNPYKSQLTEVTNQKLINSGYASIKENKDFFKFLKELRSLGHEICLHTPEDKTTTKQWLEESLKFMQKNFNSVSWIDHGYDNSPMSNREDLACDGAISNSSYFALDLWKKYSVTNFWNPYFEDFPINKEYDFHSSLIKPYSKSVPSLPAPLVSIHPNFKFLKQFYTYSVTEAPNPELWNYYFNEQRLSDFIKNKGTLITHVYPASAHNNYGFWQINNNSVEITPEFNQTLARIADKRNKGLIHISTIENWINNVEEKKQLKYRFTNDGIYLFNPSNKTITNIGIFYPDKAVTNFNFEAGKLVKLSE